MKQTHLWITDIDPCIYTWPALFLGHKIRTLYRHLSKHLSKHLSSYIIDRSGGVPALVNKRWHSHAIYLLNIMTITIVCKLVRCLFSVHREFPVHKCRGFPSLSLYSLAYLTVQCDLHPPLPYYCNGNTCPALTMYLTILLRNWRTCLLAFQNCTISSYIMTGSMSPLYRIVL